MKQLNQEKISSLIQKEIEKNLDNHQDTKSIGQVITVGDGICTVYGLDDCMVGELVSFKNGIKGMVMSLEQDYVGVILFSGSREIVEGDLVTRTKQIVEVKVGDALLGRVVDSLSNPIDNLGPIDSNKYRPVERIAPGVMTRKSVSTPLETGIKAIDLMIPIGRGQRELIIGDRQTGKTSIALDTIINQKGKNCICIYVAIGQKQSTVVRVNQILKEHDCMDYTIIVSATSSELDSLKYLAPYSGMAMAEEFMEQGKDVLIIFDDLSKHAVSYRTLSLLLRRSPGREAYPGDVFYLHSRLLERACRLNENYGGGSITCLPIIETQANDISAYIPTNVISITDGQIFLKSDLFNKGQRPAIDSGLSVSRVGSSAQYKCIKKVSKSLKIEIASYHDLLSFSQFGSDLDNETLKVLKHGEILMETLKQEQYHPYSALKQTIEIFAVQNKFLDNLEVSKVKEYLDLLYSFLEVNYKDLLQRINRSKDLTNDDMFLLKEACEKFAITFVTKEE